MTLFYPDISSYEAGISLSGMAAVVVKATEGTTYTNPDYARVAGDATSMGIPWAAYHFLHHSTSGSAQAQHYHSVAGNAPCMLDVETATDGTKATVSDALDFASALAGLGGHVRLVYLPNWYWQELGSPDLTPLARAGMALVSSDYTTYSDTGPGWAAYGGVAPVVWQYTDAHQLNGFTVDMNAYRGTVDQFRQLLAGPASAAPQEDTMPAPITASVPTGFAFDLDANGNPVLTDATKLLALSLPAGTQAGLPWGAEYVSLGADLLGGASPRLRVAISDGANWTSIDTNFRLTSGQRRNIGTNGSLPAPANGSAYVISIGRIRQSPPAANGSETDTTGLVPVSVLAELGSR